MNKELNNIELLKELEADFIANFKNMYTDDIYSKSYYNFYDDYKNDKSAIVDYTDLEYQYLRYYKISIFLRLKYIWYRENEERISNKLLDDISAFLVYRNKREILDKINSSESFCISLLNGIKNIAGYSIDDYDDEAGLLPEEVENKYNTDDLILAKSDELDENFIIGEISADELDKYLKLLEASGVEKAILDNTKELFKVFKEKAIEHDLDDYFSYTESELLAISQALSIPDYKFLKVDELILFFKDFLCIEDFIRSALLKFREGAIDNE